MEYTKIKVGDKFNKLKIVEFLGYDKWGKNKLVRCLCKCGKESITSLSSVKRGHTKTCGNCNRVEIGDVFGKLKVIGENGKDNTFNRLMVCKCECGNINIVQATRLRTGNTKSCGKCYRIEIGDVYGDLTVISEAGKDSGNRRRLMCKCSCGNIHEVDAYNLRRGDIKTCGRCNETVFRIEGKVSYGILQDGSEFYFDTLKLNLVRKYQWHSDNDRYIKTAGKKGESSRLLHRMIINAKDNKVVDHIDGNPRNNLLTNLRLCTRQENVFNSKICKSNKTGFTGVQKLPNGNYRAVIMYNRKSINIGRYDNLYDAALVRNEAAKLLFGEFARLNGMPEAPESIKKYVYEKCKKYLTKNPL